MGKEEKKKEKDLNPEHIRLHTLPHEKGLWYGNGDPTTCNLIISRCTITPYTLLKIDEAHPNVYFDINGFRVH